MIPVISVRPPRDSGKRIGTTGPGWWAYALIIGVLGAFGFGMGLLIWHATSEDDEHYDRTARESRVACGQDRSLAVDAHDMGWWYEVTCQAPDGNVYVVVVR